MAPRPALAASAAANAASAARAAAAGGAPGVVDPRLVGALATIDQARASAEAAAAQTAGSSALELDEIKAVWDGERRAALASVFEPLRQPAGQAPAALGSLLAAVQRGDIAALLSWLSDQETVAIKQLRAAAGAADATSRTAATQLARQQGALALGIDDQAALAAFRRVVELDGNDVWSHIAIGELLARANDVAGATQAYVTAAGILRSMVQRDSTPTPSAPAAGAPAATLPDRLVSHRHALLVCEFRQGELQASADQRDEALAAFQRALVVAEALLEAQPERADRQFELATVSDRVAELLTARNLWEEALAAHRRSMTLAETLAANDPDNEPQWQFYLKDKLEHIADLQLALGRPDQALENYRRGIDLGEKLVAIDITNDAWLGGMLGLIAKLGSTDGLAQTGEERRQLLLRGLELLGRVRSGEIWDNSEEWGDRLREALNALPHPSDEAEAQ
ncbi:MAG: hypothetical protein RL375_2369 [Pseudomonadota bacterium]